MQTIGKYQVLEVLGQGGMGVVYRARDNAIGRQVALKVMRPEVVNSADLRERFLREARAAGNLQHPNIVVVYDLGEDAGSPYIAMEFLSGQALDKALDAGSLNTTEKLQLFAQICDGLEFAHEAGVVHRDIKPANVMLVRSGAKLLDFGIARVQGSQITRGTAIIGTVSYMSPEQIRGKGVDARSDIFSAGVMLYEMLGGRRPFDQDSDFDTMQAIVGQEPPELRVEGAISPDTLASLVRRALEKDPANRYQTAAEFGEAIRGYLTARDRSGMAPTVVRSRPEMGGAAVARAPIPTPAPPAMVPPTVLTPPQGAIPEASSGGARVPSKAASNKKPRRLVVWALVVAAVVIVVLFVPASRFAPFWLTPTPHPEHVLGSVQLRLVAPANPAAADKFQLKGTDQSYELERASIVDQSDIVRATAEFDPNTRPQVFLTLNANGAEKMRKASAQNIGRQMAIVVGGELVEVATIQSELGDSIAISGMQTPAEAEDLAKRINGESR